MPSSPVPAAASGEEVVTKSPPPPAEDSASKDVTKEEEEKESENEVNTSEDAESESESDAGSEAESGDDTPQKEKVPSATDGDAPPLPEELVPDVGPPLPKEPVPQTEDDGWDCQWDPNSQSWFFYNRLTGKTQWENPRVPDAASVTAPGGDGDGDGDGPQPPTDEAPAAGGYNPAIHGDYDPNAWYAQTGNEHNAGSSAYASSADPAAVFGASVAFNRTTGGFQTGDMGPERHTDDAKSRRQMNAYFDVDAAANAHGGRSLKAERSNKKPSKSELKAFKEKRRARKEEKRRAWLRD